VGTVGVCRSSLRQQDLQLLAQFGISVTGCKAGLVHRSHCYPKRWILPCRRDGGDGVHLSLHGDLTTPGIAIPLSNNDGATVLAGRNPDATWWLNRDVTVIDDQPALWRRYDDGWAQS
jgi:hypothetical protein